MKLNSGHRLGPYEIVAPLGAGGMGEVYRAKDTRLGRDVAIKVLPAHLSTSTEVRARFEREAKTVSSLNHPHICTLHDVGREGEIDYLVMELIEGETLADRLAKGALPTADALRIGSQIADALDRAHRAGVIHRDLKPGNVMLTRAGAKLMDFGLARATGMGGPAGTSGVTMAALTQSPTIAQPLTAEGTIIGTFQYMSPEQLEGKEADARSDIWALGCVFYEMATGRRAFEGQSQASLIGAIMSKEPAAVSQLSPASPPALDPIVRACLAKDPEDRLQTAHDVKLQLDWIGAGSESGAAAVTVAPRAGARLKTREWIAWGVAGVALIAALVAWVLRPPPPAAPPIWSTINTPPEALLSIYSCNVVVSPTGRAIVFTGVDTTGRFSLWVRSLDAAQAKVLFQTSDAWWPFWSPDGESVAFFDRTEHKLMRVATSGGSSTVICDAPDGRGGTWSRSGDIVFTPVPEGPLYRVPASGGTPEAITTLDAARGESGHRFPCFLPDGEHYLFTTLPEGPDGFDVFVASLSRGVIKRVMTAHSAPVYVEPGYLVYQRSAQVVVQPFDTGKLEVHGQPVAIADAPAASDLDADPVASASTNGLMTILNSPPRNAHLEWLDRSGIVRHRFDLPRGPWRVSGLSRDGQHAVAAKGVDLWIVDLARSVPMRFATGTPGAIESVWSPDGQRIAYVTRVAGRDRIDIARLDGSSEPLIDDTAFKDDDAFKRVFDWSPDGRYLVYGSLGSETAWDLYVVPLEGDRKPVRLTHAKTWEFTGRISPDGKWIAYQANESGRYEIYVQSFPEPGRKVRVTIDGGTNPTWSESSRELIYQRGPTMMVVGFEAGEAFEPGIPRPLFTLPPAVTAVRASFDGRGFLVSTPAEDVRRDIHLVMNWPALLR